ncbi:MAG: hypothetical protein ACXV5H_07105 [Halobacteriota archaeon]
MLAAELHYDSVLNSRDPALSEIYRSTISLHHAKERYNYPTIRLPHTLAKLAGLPAHIYQTIHEGALAFLVVIADSSSESENIPYSVICFTFNVWSSQATTHNMKGGMRSLFTDILIRFDFSMVQLPENCSDPSARPIAK